MEGPSETELKHTIIFWYVTNRFKYKLFFVITQLSVTVTLLYFCKKYITYFTEIKEENSSSIASS